MRRTVRIKIVKDRLCRYLSRFGGASHQHTCMHAYVYTHLLTLTNTLTHSLTHSHTLFHLHILFHSQSFSLIPLSINSYAATVKTLTALALPSVRTRRIEQQRSMHMNILMNMRTALFISISISVSITSHNCVLSVMIVLLYFFVV